MAEILSVPPSGRPALVLNADFRPLSYYPLSLWPWQEVVSWRTDSSGNQVPLEQMSVSPMRYAEVTGEPAQITVAVVALLVGLALVLLGEWVAGRRSQAPSAA